MASLTEERRLGGSSKQGGGLTACTCVCMCTAVTAATCHLFYFKAAGVTQVLWWRGQERCGCPGVPASSLRGRRQQVAAGRWGTFLPPSAGPGPGWPK